MTVLFDVFVVDRIVGRMVDEALAGTGLNGFDYAMTSMLRGHGPTSPQRIASLTGMKPTTTSGVLRRLEERGFVERRPNPDDGRSVLVTLTDAGEQRTGAALREFDRVRARVEEHLAGRLAAVRSGLQDLDDAVRAVVGLAERPYRVPSARVEEAVGLLGPEQHLEAARFQAWLLERDGGPR